MSWNFVAMGSDYYYEPDQYRAKVLFNNYVEIFKEQDTSVISRESRRVLEALEKLNDSYEELKKINYPMYIRCQRKEKLKKLRRFFH